MSEPQERTYFWCQIPGNAPPCPECEDAGLDECLPSCPDYTIDKWTRLGQVKERTND